MSCDVRPDSRSNETRRSDTSRFSVTAVVSHTRPCATTGDDQPRPATGAFHATFLTASHSIGSPLPSAMPWPVGPRNCCHCARIGCIKTAEAASARNILPSMSREFYRHSAALPAAEPAYPGGACVGETPPVRRVSAFALAVLWSACSSPLRRSLTTPSPPDAARQAPIAQAPGRTTVGVAFGGGSARGIAHVGVIRWLEEHRIPIDFAAGTSMGGLIGGGFATGMDAADLERMLASIDWDTMFGASTFPFRNIRRKADARAYPSRLEFGLKGGLVPPPSLDRGEQVERLLGRITAPYFDVGQFDHLPTPFRAVAVDLIRAEQVVLDHGSLAQALRATMSMPLIFPPVELDGRILVDGGVMNNVPADVVKAMGADRVIAINVGDLANPEGI